MPGHPELTAPGGFVCLSVTDTGIGMDAETVARAAEPFFTTKPIGKGTGLGLALAFRYCRHAGGALTIESRAGTGTTIRLYLPAGKQAARTGEAASGPAAARFAIPGPMVILVQHEPVVRDGLRTALLSRGFRVLDAAETRAGSAGIAADLAPDVLVTDLSTGNGSMSDEVRTWRARAPALKVVALRESAAHCDAIAGPVIRLVKPVSPSDVAEAAVRLIAGASAAESATPADATAPA